MHLKSNIGVSNERGCCLELLCQSNVIGSKLLRIHCVSDKDGRHTAVEHRRNLRHGDEAKDKAANSRKQPEQRYCRAVDHHIAEQRPDAETSQSAADTQSTAHDW